MKGGTSSTALPYVPLLPMYSIYVYIYMCVFDSRSACHCMVTSLGTSFQANLYSVVDTAEDFGLVLAKGLKGWGRAEERPLVKANIGELFCLPCYSLSCGETSNPRTYISTVIVAKKLIGR